MLVLSNMIAFYLLFLIPSFVLCQDEKLEMMVREGIIPDVIPTRPSLSLKVTFGTKEVSFGNELTPTDVNETPTLNWKYEKDTYYTLMMVDPDAPSREEHSDHQVIHWLVTNIIDGDASKGQTIVNFISSGPAKASGLHRYAFLVYKQPSYLSFDEPKIKRLSRAPRLHFSVKEFAEKYNYGNPVAGNYYVAKWDPYCDVLDKMITD